MNEIPNPDDLRAAEEIIDTHIHQMLEQAFGESDPVVRQLLWTEATQLNERLRKTRRARMAEVQ